MYIIINYFNIKEDNEIYVIRLYNDYEFKGKLYLTLKDCNALRYVWEGIDNKNFVNIEKATKNF